ncbi:MAG: 50S ribosomal protein L17 [Erysipelotrichaceae bacterium]|nr:50S ribosomal protein L17 [Erysipelotrichaceae bacterium]MDD3809902.1 50S ribosomal protein L17 [Erysipelotrichaceae bacterium]
MAKNRKLGRTSDIRKSMLRSLATEVIVNGQIRTTETRAKEVRSVVEELITLGKRGDLHARRQAAAEMHKVSNPETGKNAVQILFDEVAPKFEGVNGGYTRIYKLDNRKGDNAPMALLQLTK